MDDAGNLASLASSSRPSSGDSRWGSVDASEIRQLRRESAMRRSASSMSIEPLEDTETTDGDEAQTTRRAVTMEYSDEMTLSVETMPMPDFQPGVPTPIPSDSILAFMKTQVKEGSAKVFTVGFTTVFLSAPSQQLLTSCFWYAFLHHFRSNASDVYYFKHLQMDLMSAYYRSTFFLASAKEKDIILQRYPDIAAQTLYAVFCGCFPFSRKYLDEDFRKLLLMACTYWFTGRKLFNPSVAHWQQQKVLQQVMGHFEREREQKQKRVAQFFDYSELRKANARLGVGTSSGIFVAGPKHGNGRGMVKMEEIRQDFRDLYAGNRPDKCDRRTRKDEWESLERQRSLLEETLEAERVDRGPALLMNANPVWKGQDVEDQAAVSDNQFQLCGTSPLVQRYITLTSRLTSSVVAKNSMEDYNASLKLPNLDPEYDDVIMKGLVSRSAYSVLHTASHVQDGVSAACYYASAAAARALNDAAKRCRTAPTGSADGPRGAQSVRASTTAPSARSTVSFLQGNASIRRTPPRTTPQPAPTIQQHGGRQSSAKGTPPRVPASSHTSHLRAVPTSRPQTSPARSTSCPPDAGRGTLASGQLPLLPSRPSSASRRDPLETTSAVGNTFITDLEVAIPDGAGEAGQEPIFLFPAPQNENRAAGKAPGDYRRTFRGLENPASCQRVAKYTQISYSDLQAEMQQPDPNYTSAAQTIVRHSQRIQSVVDPESSRLEIVQTNRIGEYHKSQILATSEKRKVISAQRQAVFKEVRKSLATVLEALQDLKRLERSDPTDLQLIMKYKELIRVMDEHFPAVPANFRTLFQQFWAVKLPKLRILVGYYKAHHKAQLVEELRAGKTATLDLLMLPDEVERFRRQQEGMVDISQVKSKVSQNQANSMQGIMNKKREIAERAMEKMIAEGMIRKPEMHDRQRDAQERRALRQQMAYRRQLEMKLGFRVDFDEWDNDDTDEDAEEVDDISEEDAPGGMNDEDDTLEQTIRELTLACNADRSPKGSPAGRPPPPCIPKSILKPRVLPERSSTVTETLSPSHKAMVNAFDCLSEPESPTTPPAGCAAAVIGSANGAEPLLCEDSGVEDAEAPGTADGSTVTLAAEDRATEDASPRVVVQLVDEARDSTEAATVGPSVSLTIDPFLASGVAPCTFSPTAVSEGTSADLLSSRGSPANRGRRPSRLPPSLQAIADLNSPSAAEMRDLERAALLRLGVKEFEFGGVAVVGNTVMWTNSHKLLSESADEMLLSLKNRKKAKGRSYGLETAPLG